MTDLSVLEQLHSSATDIVVRTKCIRALMEFNGLTFRNSLLIEETLFHLTRHRAPYVSQAKRVMFNLASNKSLHKIDPTALSYISDADMAQGTIVECVQKQERLRHDKFLNMIKEKSSASVDESESVIHCRKCGSADLSFVQVQTRSADEPMTCMFGCNSCGLKWRMG